MLLYDKHNQVHVGIDTSCAAIKNDPADDDLAPANSHNLKKKNFGAALLCLLTH